jgi:hypothetical protein
MSFGRLVKDHHRTTERHTPQPARVSLAELRDLVEPALSDLWLDLAIGRRYGAKQSEQRKSVEMVPNLHRPLPLRSLQTRRTRPRELLDSEFTGNWPFRSSRSLLAMTLPLFSRLFQLPVSLGMDLLLTTGEHVLRRDIANGTIQADIVMRTSL